MKGRLEILARPFDGATVKPGAVVNVLSHTQQEKLRAIATVLECKRGVTICSQREEARSVYVVDEGMVRLSRSAENGQRHILAFMIPGDLFGLPDNGRYVDSAETVSATRLYQIPWQQMQQMMLAEPQLQLTVLSKVAHDFHQAQMRIMHLTKQNTCQKVASYLLDLADDPEFFDQSRSVLKLPVNRFDLADFIGSAPESTARAFAKLESLGLVQRVTSRKIEILDQEGLRSVQRGPYVTAKPHHEPALLKSPVV
jgi:CRP-like cAMP-binding protein